MSSHELGAPAYRKYDLEAWLPAPEYWGEVGCMNSFVHSKCKGGKYFYPTSLGFQVNPENLEKSRYFLKT